MKHSINRITEIETEMTKVRAVFEDVLNNETLSREIFNDIFLHGTATTKIFYLYFISNMKTNEIAMELNLPLFVVKRKLYVTIERQKRKFNV